jgi:23S rRNA (pseudouridine1915-N3)-methyltransferase
MNSSKIQLKALIYAAVIAWVAAFGPVQRLSSRPVSFGCSRNAAGVSYLYMGMNVNIRIVGRKSGSEKWLEEACSMYETRLRPSNVEVETTWHKDNQALTKGIDADRSKGHTLVLLDPLGSIKTSEKFSDDMYEWLDRGGSRLSFVIGGAEGLPSELKYPPQGGKPTMISLSTMTFTHQFARLLLIEQIYRATEIRKGSGYHK